MTFRDFPQFDETNAALDARDALTRTKRAFGVIPAPVARYASSPLMLGVTLSGLHSFENAALAPLEREVLAMTMGRLNGCRLCLDMHRRLLVKHDAPASLIAALEAGQELDDARLEALRRFVVALVEHHGDVPAPVWTEFRRAGFSHQQALELVMGVGVYTITTLANRLTETSE